MANLVDVLIQAQICNDQVLMGHGTAGAGPSSSAPHPPGAGPSLSAPEPSAKPDAPTLTTPEPPANVFYVYL